MAVEIRTLARDELSFCLDLAAGEGWNPGVYDAPPFFAADPQGYFVAELDGEKIGCISAVRYATFGFIGLFIVHRDYRGKGYGTALWERALDHLRGVPVGLDAVIAQEPWYARFGFERAYLNVRYRSDAREPRDRLESQVALERLRVLDEEVLAYDRACFGSDRADFLQTWIAQPDAVALTARSLRNDALVGYGVGRECRDGTKIGPLFSSRLDVAVLLFDTIAGRTRSPWFLDVPNLNAPAIGLTDERGMNREFDCARMWRGAPPAIDLPKVYGVTTFELG
jgi:GNAT superfamily N-acetyltransferase